MINSRKCTQLLNKSTAAAVSAIEIYNKPDFKYREETFSILMINAWELLLKAKLINDSKGDFRCIFVSEKTRGKDGRELKRFYPAKNRMGNPKSVDIFTAMQRLDIDKVLKENIELLVEIRDNAIHLMNKNKLFEKKVLEVGTANLKSYVTIMNDWFGCKLDDYNFYLMPISFYHPYEIESFSLNSMEQQAKNILLYIQKKENEFPSDENNLHNIALKLETKFIKSSDDDALKFIYSNDPDAIKVSMEEDQLFKTKYTLSYKDLCVKCKEKYSNFKLNDKFNQIKKRLAADPQLARTRYLNPKSKRSPNQTFYCTEIFKELDKSYRKIRTK